MSALSERLSDLEAGLRAAETRIASALAKAGRVDPVELVVVSKTFPASDVKLLVELGVQRIGENKHQEALRKVQELPQIKASWHMLGQIQSNKASVIARWADVVESVDRIEIVERLAVGAGRYRESRGPLGVLVQVQLDPNPPPIRAGAALSEVLSIAEAIVGQERLLRLDGVMGVAPHPSRGIAPEFAFDQLFKASNIVRREFPEAGVVSAGMSEDLETAIAAGSTRVRLGGAILGTRPRVE